MHVFWIARYIVIAWVMRYQGTFVTGSARTLHISAFFVYYFFFTYMWIAKGMVSALEAKNF